MHIEVSQIVALLKKISTHHKKKAAHLAVMLMPLGKPPKPDQPVI